MITTILESNKTSNSSQPTSLPSSQATSQYISQDIGQDISLPSYLGKIENTEASSPIKTIESDLDIAIV